MENQPITFVTTDNATLPGGHYSQAVICNGLIFVSGQLGFKPGSKDPIVGSAAEQTRNCLANLEQILLAAGSDLNNVIKTTVYVSDSALWPEVNKVYAEIFADHKPARAIVPSSKLHYGFDIEIEAIARPR